MSKIIITGASGLLGRALVRTFKDASWDVVGWGFSRADGISIKKVDLTHQSAVNEALLDFVPSVLIHAAAERHPDNIEKDPEGAQRLNVTATQNLAKLCKQMKIKFIYISTDYVFDGQNPPYSEDAITNPLNAYGKSKADGEQVTLAESLSHCVFRVPILFGKIENLEESAVTVLFKAVKDSSKVRTMDSFQKRYPTNVKHVAFALLQFVQLFKSSAENSYAFDGIFHFSAKEQMTKFEMAIVLGRVSGCDTSHIQPASPSSSFGAKRPDNSQLCCKKLEKLGLSWHTNFEDEIKNVIKQYI